MMLKQILGAALAATASANIWTLRKNADVEETRNRSAFYDLIFINFILII